MQAANRTTLRLGAHDPLVTLELMQGGHQLSICVMRPLIYTQYVLNMMHGLLLGDMRGAAPLLHCSAKPMRLLLRGSGLRAMSCAWRQVSMGWALYNMTAPFLLIYFCLCGNRGLRVITTFAAVISSCIVVAIVVLIWIVLPNEYDYSQARLPACRMIWMQLYRTLVASYCIQVYVRGITYLFLAMMAVLEALLPVDGGV